MFRTGAHSIKCFYHQRENQPRKLARESFSFFLKKNKHSYTLFECHEAIEKSKFNINAVKRMYWTKMDENELKYYIQEKIVTWSKLVQICNKLKKRQNQTIIVVWRCNIYNSSDSSMD